MKKSFLLLLLMATGVAGAGTNVYFGNQPITNAISHTSNYLVAVEGTGTNATVRLVKPATILSNIPGNVAIAGVLRVTNSATIDGGLSLPLASFYLGTNWQWISDTLTANNDVSLFNNYYPGPSVPMAIGTNGDVRLAGTVYASNSVVAPQMTASRAAVFDANKRLTNSTVTSTELSLLSGQTTMAFQPTNNVLTLLAANAANTVTNVSPGANISASISAGTLSVATTGLGTAANSNAVAFVASSSGLGTNNLFYSPTNTPQASNQVAQTIQGLANQTNHLTRWESPAGTLVSAVKSNGCIVVPYGTFKTPSIGFLGDDDTVNSTGFYKNGANLTLLCAGTDHIRLSGGLVTLPNGISISFNSSSGLYLLGTGVAVGAGAGTSGFKRLYSSGVIITNNANSTIYGMDGGTYSVQTSPISNTGTAQTNLMTLSIPINTLTNNGDRITFSVSGKFVANADAKELLVIYGSETIFDSTSQVVNGGAWTITGEIIRTGNTAQTAWASYNGAGLSLFTDAAAVTLSQTNGIATLLAIAGTAAASNDITNRTMTVQYWPSP